MKKKFFGGNEQISNEVLSFFGQNPVTFYGKLYERTSGCCFFPSTGSLDLNLQIINTPLNWVDEIVQVLEPFGYCCQTHSQKS